jgi:flagellum-specific ATP synthase
MSTAAAALAREADALHHRVAAFRPAAERSGRVIAFDGLLMEVEGVTAAPGSLLLVDDEGAGMTAEVVGFRTSHLLAMALTGGRVAPGARARLLPGASDIAVGAALLGRIVDAFGASLDGRGPLRASARWPLAGRPRPPLDRAEVRQPLTTGVRAIDALFTLGRGQRVGLIAGSGVGKSVLMQQMVAGAHADAIVVALIGERGREISGFVAALSPEARARTHLVAVPADLPAPLRVRGTLRAFAVAEWLRAEGRHVLLLLDSLTRVAHAQREIGLAVGEPPGARGYPASALALIPRLAERAGNDSSNGGAVTALLTVLADGDDAIADPVVDAARGVLDGHILLDRGLAARGRFPAIDLANSVSRTMAACVPEAQLAAAAALRRDSALIEASRDLLAMGAYAPGHDMALDTALARQAALDAFVSQPREAVVDPADGLSALLAQWGPAA